MPRPPELCAVDLVSEMAIVILAGLAAGGINAVVGSGTLVTFPVLIALGYPPVVATMRTSRKSSVLCGYFCSRMKSP